MEKLKSQSGQAVIEYVLLVSIVVSFYVIMSVAMNKLKLADKILAAMSGPYKSAYQFGDVEAKVEDGQYTRHPMINGNGGSRIFVNPAIK